MLLLILQGPHYSSSESALSECHGICAAGSTIFQIWWKTIQILMTMQTKLLTCLQPVLHIIKVFWLNSIWSAPLHGCRTSRLAAVCNGNSAPLEHQQHVHRVRTTVKGALWIRRLYNCAFFPTHKVLKHSIYQKTILFFPPLLFHLIDTCPSPCTEHKSKGLCPPHQKAQVHQPRQRALLQQSRLLCQASSLPWGDHVAWGYSPRGTEHARTLCCLPPCENPRHRPCVMWSCMNMATVTTLLSPLELQPVEP